MNYRLGMRRNPPSSFMKEEARAFQLDKFLSFSMGKYPILKRTWQKNYRDIEGSIFSEKYVLRTPPRNWEKLFEQLAVYHTIVFNGPDVNASKIPRYLPRIRRALDNQSIFEAYEDGSLEVALEELGLIGPPSDELRDESDKYY